MRSQLKQFVISALTTALLVIIAFGLTLWLRRVGLMRKLEFQVYDHWMRQRATEKPADSPCVIIKVTDADIDAWQQYPISDHAMADLLDRLLAAQPAAIGLDIYRDVRVPDVHRSPDDATNDHKRLIDLFHAHPNVIVPVLMQSDPSKDISQPKDAFDSVMHPQVGSINTVEDYDRVVRRGLLYLDRSSQSEDYAVALGYRLALLYLKRAGVIGSDDQENFDLAGFAAEKVGLLAPGVGAYLPTDDYGGTQVLLDFRNPRGIESFTAGDVLAGRVPAERLSRRILLIGVCATSVKDEINTSLRRDGEIEYGVAYHARVADQIVRGAMGADVKSKAWSRRAEAAWVVLFCLLGAAAAWAARPPGRLLAGATGTALSACAIGIVLAALWFGSGAAFRHNWWIPVIPPAIGFLLSTGLVTLYNLMVGRRDRNAMMQLIGHCVSDDVAQVIWAEREDIFDTGRIRSRRLRGTVLFTDLKGFSGISEELAAPKLMRWLNEYFQGLSGLVKECEGSILKFNGDQIMAVFGPPRKRSRAEAAIDARNAVICALKMRQKLSELNDHWRTQKKPQAAMRVGIHTGWLVAGSLGSRQRLEWTVIGDTVNTASRLESVKKDLMPPDIAANSCRILISNATAALLGGAFDIRPMGRLRLKGKRRRVLVHGVRGLCSDASSADASAVGKQPMQM